jgi:hypothetical protein
VSGASTRESSNEQICFFVGRYRYGLRDAIQSLVPTLGFVSPRILEPLLGPPASGTLIR